MTCWVFDDNTGGSVQVGMDIDIRLLHVPLHNQLILLGIPPTCPTPKIEDQSWWSGIFFQIRLFKLMRTGSDKK